MGGIAFVYYQPKEMISVGKFGKSVGLKGGVRTNLFTDFPEILQNNVSLYIAYTENLIALQHIFDMDSLHYSAESNQITTPYLPLHIEHFNGANNVIRFQEIQKREEAEALCNLPFYSTLEDTRALCVLGTDEFFYFDVIGMRVIENGAEIGVVQDIQEIANTYYFVLDKNFLIPYIDRYVLAIDSQKREIATQDAIYLRA